MNAERSPERTDYATYLLILGCVSTVWLPPVSVFFAIAAVYRTRQVTGWPRRLSVAAASLCIVYTIAVAIAVYTLTFLLLTDQVHS